MLSEADRNKAADILVQAAKDRKQATPLHVTFPDITIDTQPVLSEQEAVLRARDGLPWNEDTDRVAEVSLGVLPKVWGDEIVYFLTYKVILDTEDPLGEWAVSPRLFAAMVVVVAATSIVTPLMVRPLLRRASD